MTKRNATYSATVSGAISSHNVGGVQIVFDNPVQTFTYANANGSGTFSIELPKLFVHSGDTANLTVGLTGNETEAVPEPAAMLLLGTSLVGVAAKMRRRRRNNSSE